ncbi:MAG: class I SAM-dependent methyltransferase [Spirochaeta sp.]|nr:class I SAM-dependent methyltransferase [Spirochaeta sp.]
MSTNTTFRPRIPHNTMAQTGFYTVLSHHYDALFPAEEDTLTFLTSQLSSAVPVLDAACGSGNYTHALLGKGFDVYGLDSEAGMIEHARAKGRSERFFVGDMLNLRELPPAPFGGIFCIGNSLSHVSSKAEVENFVVQAKEVMLSGGPLLLQVMNPERLIANEAVALPRLEATGVTMHRTYTYNPELELIEFTARLVTDRSEDVELSQTLLCVTEELLRRYLLRAGFTALEVAADFSGAAFERSHSPMLVISARA